MSPRSFRRHSSGCFSRLLFLNCLQSINCSVDLTALMLQRPNDLANINPSHVAFSILAFGEDHNRSNALGGLHTMLVHPVACALSWLALPRQRASGEKPCPASALRRQRMLDLHSPTCRVLSFRIFAAAGFWPKRALPSSATQHPSRVKRCSLHTFRRLQGLACRPLPPARCSRVPPGVHGSFPAMARHLPRAGSFLIRARLLAT